jgi:hypothetical protein
LRAEGDGEAGEDTFVIGAKAFIVQLRQNGPLAEHEAVAGEPHLAQKRATPGAGPVGQISSGRMAKASQSIAPIKAGRQIKRSAGGANDLGIRRMDLTKMAHFALRSGRRI